MSLRRRIDRLATRLGAGVEERITLFLVTRGVGCPGMDIPPDGPALEIDRRCPAEPVAIARVEATVDPGSSTGAYVESLLSPPQRQIYARAVKVVDLMAAP
jgi:hypothetical protein